MSDASTRADYRVGTRPYTYGPKAGPDLDGVTVEHWSALDLRSNRLVLSASRSEGSLLAALDERILGENATAPVSELERDLDGYPVRWSADLGAYRVSECCGAPATYSGGVLCCKACYEEVDPLLDAPVRLAPAA